MSSDRIAIEKIHAAHDRVFRHVFSQPEHARGVLRRILPAASAEALDWTTLALVPGSHVDAELGGAVSDLVFSIRPRGADSAPVLLYLLFEHQSTQHPHMPLRMLDYGTRALMGFMAREERRGPIPKLVPIVLHQGRGPWTAPRRLSELHGKAEGVGRLWVELEIVVHELGREHLALLSAAREMTALARATLVAMKLVSEHRNLRVHAALMARLMDQVRLAHGPRALRPLFFYLAGTRGTDHDLDAIMQSLTEETRTAVLTLSEQWEARGFARGEATLLRRQLGVRFGPLPAWVLRRVESAEVAELEAWAERLLTASSLEQIFEG